MNNLVEIRGLKVEATTDSGRRIDIIKGVDIDIADGEIVALIGESGSGKTTIELTLMGYARPGCRISGGSVKVAGQDMVQLSETGRERVRGTQVTYVPQSAAAASTRHKRSSIRSSKSPASITSCRRRKPVHARLSSSRRSHCPTRKPSVTVIRIRSPAVSFSASPRPWR